MSTPSEAARLLAARRKVVGERQCPVCGTVFVATTAGRFKRQYCSRRCQRRAWYRANREYAIAYQRAHYRRQRQAVTDQQATDQQATEPAEPPATRGQAPSAPAPATAPQPPAPATTTPPSAGQPATMPAQPVLPGLDAAPPRPHAAAIRTDGGRFRWEPADA